ncbi:hypothetical protein TIFTF001_014870 [Ficus carica]|uniref:Uncharacterized protein n=1 Tax=Ficus carica TaxID=3494 RepID=A0AA88A086_FICCA|nr:hypothetical protein TIFTF001_014870 [Ficus carica]
MLDPNPGSSLQSSVFRSLWPEAVDQPYDGSRTTVGTAATCATESNPKFWLKNILWCSR